MGTESIRYAGNAGAEEITMMRSRQAYFSKMAKSCSTLEEFYDKYNEVFTIFGNELRLCKDCVSIYITKDYDDYENYFVVVGTEGGLMVSDVLEWKDKYCSNSFLNIRTGEEA